MEPKVAVAIVACLFAAYTLNSKASPAKLESPSSSFHALAVRQSPSVCSNDSACNPSNITGYVAPSGVTCVNGACMCSGSCFVLSSVTSKCTYSADCGWYNPNTSVCTAISPKSQRNAFLLSFFVMATGAANFYIGQNALGGAQLALLLSTIILSYVTCCVRICTKGKANDLPCICSLLSCGVGLLSLLVGLAIFAWWIADLVIFARNMRTTGNGCPLTSDL